ncbi:D-alanyl-D-alanine carboxypeptidase [Enteractinococcus fodinae]|uniref:D-alanyl-D-alanine carboxypeptidase n=2 Tax=Enteractinococcus fodinae TaxID=684663 RepID=A0ABU2AZS9_9MICC|nr:D-alanyl-D-alanine carboxypeptidase [Enteractinococcus fodinae]
MAGGVVILFCSACSPATTDESSSSPTTEVSPHQTPEGEQPSEHVSSSPDESVPSHETTRPSEASFNPESNHVLVNKQHELEIEDFEPPDLVALNVPQQYGGQQLREEPAVALEELVADAADDGIELWVTTAYRDFAHQQALYEQRLAELGQEAADKFTARPGYSEHQTGLAVDMSFAGNTDCNLRECFAETEQGQWLAEHVARFGFIIRYPEGAESITGYSYEPWHLRYVGVPTAHEVTEQDVTLEEYWNQPAAPDYTADYR